MENRNTDNTSDRPFGYWLRAVDRLLTREFAEAFENEGVSRRDWRILALLSGDVAAPEFAARLQRGGGKKLRSLVERGWVAERDGAWTLTDEGRAAQARLGEVVAGIRTRVAGAVSEDDFATTLASLRAIATELGWDPDERMPRGGRRGFGPGRRGPRFGPGFGPGRGRGFGHGGRGGHGFGPEAGFDPRHASDECHHGHAGRGHGGHAHGEHAHAGHGHHAHGRAEQAYARGFDAGFTRGSAAHGVHDA